MTTIMSTQRPILAPIQDRTGPIVNRLALTPHHPPPSLLHAAVFLVFTHLYLESIKTDAHVEGRNIRDW